MTHLKQFNYQGELYRSPNGSYYIDFPYDVYAVFGTRKQAPVKVWFEGYYQRKSLLPKGGGKHMLTVSATVRHAIGKSDGDKVAVVVEQDTDPRTIELPEDLQWLFDNEPDMKARFEKQGYSNQKFFTEWIVSASDPDSRVNRINKLFEYLSRSGKKGDGRKLMEGLDDDRE
jgi:hypothetical protein